jgi:hypothetical protein
MAAMTTPIADMVRLVMAANVPPEMIVLAVESVERSVALAVERAVAGAAPRSDGGHGDVSTLSTRKSTPKQREKWRLKKRKQRSNRTNSLASAPAPAAGDTGDMSPCASLSLASRFKKLSSERETRARAKPSPVDIPADWSSSPEDERFAASRGFSAAEIADVAFKFKNWFSATGERRPDWSKAWQNWVTNERRPPGRYHAIPGGKDDPLSKARQFSEADWRQKCAFVASDLSRSWPEKHWGPAPGKPGCLVPASLQRELLANYPNQKGLNQCTA